MGSRVDVLTKATTPGPGTWRVLALRISVVMLGRTLLLGMRKACGAKERERERDGLTGRIPRKRDRERKRKRDKEGAKQQTNRRYESKAN